MAVAGGLLLWADGAHAQIGTSMSQPAPVGRAGTPAGVDEKDELHGFHRAIALQATSEQTDVFRAIVKKTEAAEHEIDVLVKNSHLQSPDEGASHVSAIRLAIETARTQTDAFVAGFSAAQKAGLKDVAAKLLRAEAELGEQEKMAEAGGDARDEAARVAHADGLRKALANVRAQQQNAAMEMSIVISEGTDEVAFTIPARKSTVTIGGQTVGVTTSAAVTRPKTGSGDDGVYRVEVRTDLAELQENMGAILGAMMNREDRCGERVRVQEAKIAPDSPSATAMVRLHYERWVCSRVAGAREMTEGNATVNMKLAPSLGANGEAQISSEIEQVEAEKFFAELLRSEALGTELREKLARAVTAAVANLKAVLPAAGDSATARSVRYEALREGELSVVVEGELRMSDEQAKAFGEQLKERAGATARKQ